MTEKAIIRSYIRIPVEFNEGQWKELSDAGGVNIPEESRVYIIEILEEYLADEWRYKNSLRLSSARDILIEIWKNACALRDGIEFLTETDDGASVSSLFPVRFKLGFLPGELDRFIQVSGTVLKEIGDDHGVDGDPYFPDMLVDLLDVFNKCGGKGSYTAPAQAFLYKICKLLDIQRFEKLDKSESQIKSSTTTGFARRAGKS